MRWHLWRCPDIQTRNILPYSKAATLAAVLLAVPCACAALLAAVAVSAALSATSPTPAESSCPGYFAIDANASYYDFKAVGTYPPGKKRVRTPEEAAAFLAGALEPAETELTVLQTNT